MAVVDADVGEVIEPPVPDCLLQRKETAFAPLPVAVSPTLLTGSVIVTGVVPASQVGATGAAFTVIPTKPCWSQGNALPDDGRSQAETSQDLC